MSGRLHEDVSLRPELFRWNGPIPQENLERWLADRSFRVPHDLKLFWQETGGGELFESETILSPSDAAEPGDDIECVNRLHWARGLSPAYLIFAIGSFGLSAIRLVDQSYALIDEDTYAEVGEFSDLTEWYSSTIRSEYAQRYALDCASGA